jgi:hypothetical protein
VFKHDVREPEFQAAEAENRRSFVEYQAPHGNEASSTIQATGTVMSAILLLSMAHTYNLRAFQAGSASPNPLLRLYSGLVVVELALKDASATWPRCGHDVPRLLAEIGEAALSVQLQGQLSTLKCTAPDGGEAPISSSNYAHLRYLRHESDYPGAVSDGAIEGLLSLLSDITLLLRGRRLL